MMKKFLNNREGTFVDARKQVFSKVIQDGKIWYGFRSDLTYSPEEIKRMQAIINLKRLSLTLRSSSFVLLSEVLEIEMEINEFSKKNAYYFLRSLKKLGLTMLDE